MWLVGLWPAWPAWFCGSQPHLLAVTPTATCFILLTLLRPPHSLLEDLGVQLSLRISALWSPMAELPTHTFPLLLLTGEQGGQAVSARRGLGPLQTGVSFRDGVLNLRV